MAIIEITDLNAPELDIYARTTENQLVCRLDPEQGSFIAESPYVISLALAAGMEPLSMLATPQMLTHELVTGRQDIPIYTAPIEVLRRLTGFELTLGLLCHMRRPKPKAVADLCQTGRRLVVLEHIMNPTNVGALMRCAAALGMDGVLLTPDCADPLYRRAARVSMGTVFQIPWAYFESNTYAHNIRLLKSRGFTTVAMALSDNSVAIHDPCLSGHERLAVVMGSEGTGLSEQTIAACDYTARIPMHHGVDSLNVAAAGALAFWELSK